MLVVEGLFVFDFVKMPRNRDRTIACAHEMLSVPLAETCICSESGEPPLPPPPQPATAAFTPYAVLHQMCTLCVDSAHLSLCSCHCISLCCTQYIDGAHGAEKQFAKPPPIVHISRFKDDTYLLQTYMQILSSLKFAMPMVLRFTYGIPLEWELFLVDVEPLLCTLALCVIVVWGERGFAAHPK